MNFPFYEYIIHQLPADIQAFILARDTTESIAAYVGMCYLAVFCIAFPASLLIGALLSCCVKSPNPVKSRFWAWFWSIIPFVGFSHLYLKPKGKCPWAWFFHLITLGFLGVWDIFANLSLPWRVRKANETSNLLSF